MKNISANKVIFPVLSGFFVMGFVDIVGIATNYVKADFKLSDTLANLLPMMVFLWFALFSIPSGILMGKTGRRNTVVISLLITAVAMLIPVFFYNFISVLLAFALLGIGNTILQVSLNPMIAHVVRQEKITSVLTLGQFIKALSSFLGPIIAAATASLWGDWKLTFVVYSMFKDNYIVGLFLGILFIVGIDVGLNTSIPKLLMDKTGMLLSEAGLGSSVYFAARTTGSFLGAILLAKIRADRFLKYTMFVAIAAFILLLIADMTWLIFTLIVVLGLMCSNVFSIIFSYALQHKPQRSNEISALMIMGVSGGALITPLMGILADGFGQTAGLSILLVCLLYLSVISFKLKKPS